MVKVVYMQIIFSQKVLGVQSKEIASLNISTNEPLKKDKDFQLHNPQKLIFDPFPFEIRNKIYVREFFLAWETLYPTGPIQGSPISIQTVTR